MVFWNGYWRIGDHQDGQIYALNDSFQRVSSEDITALGTGASRIRGLATDGTNLYAVFEDTPNGHYVRMYDSTGFVREFDITGYPAGSALGAVAWDSANSRLLVGLFVTSTNSATVGSFAVPPSGTTTTAQESSIDMAASQSAVRAMVWYEGYLFTTDSLLDRFFIYDLSDNNNLLNINPDVSPFATLDGLGQRDGRLYMVDRTIDDVQAWDIQGTTTLPSRSSAYGIIGRLLATRSLGYDIRNTMGLLSHALAWPRAPAGGGAKHATLDGDGDGIVKPWFGRRHDGGRGRGVFPAVEVQRVAGHQPHRSHLLV